VKIHVINHHFWPDGSPSAVLEEELADALRQMGHDTVLVAGSGSFHDLDRPAPQSPIIRLTSGEAGKRDSQIDILRDYRLFWKAVRSYIREQVGPEDAVLATSSPFLNVFLIAGLHRRAPGVKTIFHLHDYLPSNLRSLGVLYRMAAPFVKRITDHYLQKWGRVISCAGNIAYTKDNCVVARFWPTITADENRHMASGRRALYAGNLGIAHDVTSLVDAMDDLHGQGWEIDFYGDGPMVSRLPAYVNRHPFVSGEEYIDVLYGHPIHFVTGVGRDGTGAFPSKTHNSLYIGAHVVPCGFSPEMVEELDYLRTVPDLSHNRWVAAEAVSEYLGTPAEPALD